MPIKYRINHYNNSELRFMGYWKDFISFEDCLSEWKRVQESNLNRVITIEYRYEG